MLAQPASAELTVPLTNQRVSVPVRTLLDFRESNLVRQGWDVSCGAAALSSVLTYAYDRPYSEATIALTMLANSDPKKIRERGGFSLLDLKRFSEAVGFTATGYGKMTVEDLAKNSFPAILPVRIRNFDHFVVFRRALGNRVEIGDPAFGNMIVARHRFEQMWQSRIAFYVRPPNEAKTARHSNPMELAIGDLKAVYRTNLQRLTPTPQFLKQVP